MASLTGKWTTAETEQAVIRGSKANTMARNREDEAHERLSVFRQFLPVFRQSASFGVGWIACLICDGFCLI
jgi:hypothetical protein